MKPTIKTQRKPNMVKKTIDLENSNDDTEVLNFEKPSIYDQALHSVNKTSPQKNKKMKILKTEKVTQNYIRTQTLNSERVNKPVIYSFNLQDHIRKSSGNVSEDRYQSP